MRRIRDLNAAEIRILGALLEKEQATPDYYPLTMSSLVAACNQKSNRDPVTSMTAGEIEAALETLRQDVLVWRSEGSRSVKWSQSISRRLALDSEETAILTVLMLRGPQTPGELRARTARLHAFTGISKIEAALDRMALEDRELVAELDRRPGQKENRWMHRLGGEIDGAPAEEFAGAWAIAPSEPTEAPTPGLEKRVAELEERIEALEAALARLAEGSDPPTES
jgi:uncharacterized protein YceH (UPF0502 family)